MKLDQVFPIYKRIPRTLKSLLKLKINFYKESLKQKIYKSNILLEELIHELSR